MKINKSLCIIGILMIIAGVLLIVVKKGSSSNANPSSSNSGLQEQTNSDNDIIVTVTPGDPNSSSPTWNFQIGLNTHSGDLTQDITKITELSDNQGRVYKPIEWQGPPPGGHHINGILKFSKPDPTSNPSSIQLTISQVGGVDRVFKWQLH